MSLEFKTFQLFQTFNSFEFQNRRWKHERETGVARDCNVDDFLDR
jgi:hypothetical protein